MRTISRLSELPRVPAVYALLGGHGRNSFVAYVGEATSLRRRIEQHLVRRNSSVVTRTSAVSLNPEFVTEVHWWEHIEFDDSAKLEAGELVAFDVCKPVLHSRSDKTGRSLAFYQDQKFYSAMHALFERSPTGRLLIPSLSHAFERIAVLEHKLAQIEGYLTRSERPDIEPPSN